MSELKNCPWCAESIRAQALVEPGALRALTAPWSRRKIRGPGSSAR